MSGGYRSSGFEIDNRLDARAYPVARANRKGPPSATGGVGGAPPSETLLAPPQSYVFGFTLRANANTRSTVSTPKLRGPSIVRGLHYAKGGTAEGLQGILLGKSLSDVVEVNVANTVTQPFTRLFTPLAGSGSTNGAPGGAVSPVDFQTNLLDPTDNLGFVVLDRDWFLVISQVSGAVAAPDDFSGYVTVLDQVPLENLAFFVG